MSAAATKPRGLRPPKGPVKAHSSGSDRAAHIDRPPACAGKLSSLTASCTTVDFPTHSVIRPLPREPLHTTLKSEFDLVKAKCLEVFNSISEKCEAEGKLFFDKEFFLGKRESLYPAGSPDDCTVCEPKDLHRAEDLLEHPPVFDGTNEGEEVDGSDIVQGSVGDCFLIGAISGLANYTKRFAKAQEADEDLEDNFTGADADPVQRIFAAYDIEHSVYAVMFYKMGGWEWVIVDGLVAGDGEGGALYANCGPNEKELWPVILEKAFAKLHGSWDLIDGGFSGAALCDMTGGVSINVDLKETKWADFLAMGQNPLNVMCCGVRDDIEEGDGGRGRCGEESGPKGLIKGHAYTVVDVRETSDKKAFVRVRNPWGNDAEWTGDWSDRSPLWARNPKYKKELDYIKADDGMFWMSAQDFKKYFTVELVSFFPDTSQVLTLYGKGGSGKPVDHAYVVKLDEAAKLRVIVGQSDYRVAEVILGKSANAHGIAKGRLCWDVCSEDLKVVVTGHGNTLPKVDKFKPQKGGKVLAEQESSQTEVVFVDVEAPKGFLVIHPVVGAGADYYVRILAPSDSEATLFRLSQGVSSAVGFTEFTLDEEEEDEEGDEEGEEDEEEGEEEEDEEDDDWPEDGEE